MTTPLPGQIAPGRPSLRWAGRPAAKTTSHSQPIMNGPGQP